MSSLRHIVVILLVGVAAVGCTGEELMARISDAERIAESDPSTALRIMRTIDRDDIYGEEDNARYALVYSEALYYGDVTVDSDTLTHSMMLHYLTSSNHSERVRALYHHALVAHAAGHNADAMYSLMESVSSFAHDDNYRCQGLIYRTMGDIYNEEWMFGNALDSYASAIECFDRANLPEHSAYARYDLALTHLAKRDYAAAEQTLYEIYDLAGEQNDEQLLVYSAHLLCRCFLQQGKYELCGTYLPIFESCEGLSFYYNCFSAVYHASKREFKKAHDYLDKAGATVEYYGRDETYVEFIVYDYAVCIVAYFEGDIETSYKKHRENIAHQDSEILKIIGRPIFNAQLDLYQRDLSASRQQLADTKRLYLYIIIGISVVVLAIIAYAVYRRRRYLQELEVYLNTIHELQLITHDSIPTDLTHSVETLYNDILGDFNQLFDVYYEHSNSSRHSNKVLAQVASSIDTLRNDENRIKELERVVNLHNDDVMRMLREQCSTLTERDLKIILYTLSGFTTNAICLFVNTNQLNLAKIKYRIRCKIKESGVNAATELIDLLYSKHPNNQQDNSTQQ